MGKGVRRLPDLSAGTSAGLGQKEGGYPAAGNKSQADPVASSGESFLPRSLSRRCAVR